MVKCVIYARQSSGDEEESASVELQIEQCKNVAENNGYTIVGTYSDKNTSGKTYPNFSDAIKLAQADGVYLNWLNSSDSGRKKYRDGLGKVFEQLTEIDYVIVLDFTRLMRPITDSFLESYIKQKFLSNKVKVHSVKEGLIDFTSFSAGLITSLESRVNDNQIRLAKEKSMAELKKKKDDGYRTTGADFLGFKYAGHQKVSVDEKEMEIVKKIFKGVLEGKKYTTICQEINADVEGRVYRYFDIMKVVKRLEYSGHCYNSKGEIIKSKVFPELIPLSTILEAQKAVAPKRFSNRDKEKTHPLSGLVFCGNCGKNMIICKSNSFANANEDGPTYYYECKQNDYIKQEDKCNISMIREDYHVEFNGLLEACLPFLVIHLVKELTPEENVSSNKDDILIKLEKISKLEKMLDKKLMEDVITEDEYNDRFSAYAQEKHALKVKLVEYSQTVDKSKIEEQVKRMVQHRFIPYNTYKKLAQQVFKKILVHNNYIEVYLNKYSKAVILERLKVRNSLPLPKYKIDYVNGKYVITYFYKSYYKDAPEKAECNTILEDENIIIKTLGNNINKRQSRRKNNGV